MSDYTLSGDEDGNLVAVLFHGHDITDEEALDEAVTVWDERGADWQVQFGFEPPRRVWMFTLPDEFSEQALHEFEDTGEYGGRPVTVVEPRDTWRHRCAVCGGRGEHGVYALAEYAGRSILDVDESELVHPLSDAQVVWFCRDHGAVLTGIENGLARACAAPCGACGHALGGHRRPEGDGCCWGANPFGPETPVPCGCGGPSPHQVRVTLGDIAAGVSFADLWQPYAEGKML